MVLRSLPGPVLEITGDLVATVAPPMESRSAGGSGECSV